jgi:hypothetical protein
MFEETPWDNDMTHAGLRLAITKNLRNYEVHYWRNVT